MLWDYSDHKINSLIIKVTEGCNLQCEYCYVKKGKREKVMGLDTVKKILIEYCVYMRKCGIKDEPLYIVWHGGEPLSCGLNYYEHVVNIEREVQEIFKEFTIVNAIQINGTLIDEDYAKFFSERKFGVGISIDGPQKFHDLYRKTNNGEGTFEKIKRNLDILKRNKTSYTAICVINKNSVGHEKEYYEVFKELNVAEVDFIPSFYQKSKHNLLPKEYKAFLIELYDIYRKDKYKTFSIRVFDDILRSILYEYQGYGGSIGCEYAGRCGENFSISVNGDVYPCDCLINYEQLKVGNIKASSFSEIIEGESFLKFQKNVNCIPRKCLSCTEKHICKAGCFNRRILTTSSYTNKDLSEDIYCEARKGIIRHVLSSI